ncbi:subtilase [Microdochium trichocladiopsis]|uniref:Subtilase n=1 Tax=Microdochium trichocladiopsis TaxID=1682393 RepID=A0A9P9BRJ8_9PEZI|nr:subtilase [Microdochium trichocladiopsis]KAH7035968.1 subtilase [Microdochium trichocladiopsis]
MMLLLRPRAVALAALFASLAQGFEPVSAFDEDQAPMVSRTRAYILEYDTTATHLIAKRAESFLQHEIEVVSHFDSPVFSGAQIVAAGHGVEELTALPGVIRAWSDVQVDLLAPVHKREEPASAEDASKHDVHWATGVDKLHQRSVLGEGVKIGIVDTGILYSHSALGGGFGPGFKVAGGYDLVGRDWAPGGVPRPGPDPIDQQGHGTHVAGIVAGDAAATGWKGVAPGASLYAYKVFGASGSTDVSVVIAALLRAYDDGMDIITASLGGPSGFPDNVLAVVANRIAAEGVIVTFAAGNAGAAGPFFPDNGGAGDLVLSVASADVNGTTRTLQPSSYTSWGGLYDLSAKPDIAAPGRDIFSCWIGSDNNTFRLVSGTSMATPYVAGVAALYLAARAGARSKELSKEASMRIISSGVSLDSASSAGGVSKVYKAPAFQVGTGLINALSVVDSTASISLARLALNDTQNMRSEQEIMVYNGDETALTFTFGLEAAAGYEMLQDRNAVESSEETPRIKSWQDLAPIKAEARLIAPAQLQLGPGESGKVSLGFTAPTGLNATALPLYSGKLLVKASNGEQLSVPYQGLGFDLFSEMRTMFSGAYPLLRAGFPPKDATTFNFDLSTGAQSYPKIFSKMKWGTRELRWDIYEQGFRNDDHHWRYPPVVGEQGYVGSATSWASAGQVSMFDPAKHNASNIISFPLADQTRNALVSGSFTSTYYWIKPGNYTMRFAALKPFGDRARSDGWSALTRDFMLNHAMP